MQNTAMLIFSLCNVAAAEDSNGRNIKEMPSVITFKMWAPRAGFDEIFEDWHALFGYTTAREWWTNRQETRNAVSTKNYIVDL